MMGWVPTNYFAAPRNTAGPYHLLMPYGAPHAPRSRSLVKDRLPGDYPDYLAYVTRHSLLGFTTSLTKVSSDVHSFFVRLNQILLFDRMMRSFMPWAMPGAAQAGFNMAQPWLMPAPQPQQQMLSFWGAPEVRTLPAPMANYAAQATQQLAMAQANDPVFAAMMAVPAAFLSFAPTVMDAWRVAL